MTYKCGFKFILINCSVFLMTFCLNASLVSTCAAGNDEGVSDSWALFCDNSQRDAFSDVFSFLDSQDIENLFRVEPLYPRLQDWRQNIWRGMVRSLPFLKKGKIQGIQSILFDLEQEQSQTPEEREKAEKRDSLFQKTLLFPEDLEAIQANLPSYLGEKSVLYLPRQGVNDLLFHNRQRLLETCGWLFSFPYESTFTSSERDPTPDDILFAHLVRTSPDYTFPMGAVAFRPKNRSLSSGRVDPEDTALKDNAWGILWETPTVKKFLEEKARTSQYILFTQNLTPEQLPEGQSYIVMTDSQLRDPNKKDVIDALMAPAVYESGKSPTLVLDVGNTCDEGVLSSIPLPFNVRFLHVVNTRGNVQNIEADFLSGSTSLEALEMHLPNLRETPDELFNHSPCKKIFLDFPRATTIGKNLLCGAKALKEGALDFPKAQSLGRNCLTCCDVLENVSVNLPSLREVGDNFISTNPLLERVKIYLPSTTKLGSGVAAYNEQAVDVEVRLPRVKEMEEFLFYGNEHLEKVDVSGTRSVESLKGDAFERCSRLQTIICYDQKQKELLEQYMKPQIREQVTWQYIVPPEEEEQLTAYR